MLVSLTAANFLRYVNWAIFLLIGLWVVTQAVRRPTRASINVGLLFGGLAIAIVGSAMVSLGLIPTSPLLASINATALFSMPFLLVRLMDDVVGVPRTLMRVFMGVFALYLIAAWTPMQQLLPFVVPLLLGLLATLVYVVVLGVRAARRSHGITRRRLTAVTVGSLFLALNFSAGRLPIAPEDARSLVDIFGIGVGISYYLGFAPPGWLRRVWQGPELRDFLARSAALPQLGGTVAMLRAVEQGAAATLGAPYASVGLWDEAAQVLRFPTVESDLAIPESSDMPSARAFRLQQATFSRDTHYEAAIDARLRLRAIARVVLAAPVSISGQRLGVLAVYGPRASLFADDDLALLQVLADQTAVVLESRRLGERLARVRAREEAARLKEDFLSAAAHDLKTPLTTLVLQAQLSERRAARNPEAPVDLVGLRRISAESERLRAMVQELLDAARAEQEQLLHSPEPADLAALVRGVAGRYQGERHAVLVEAPELLQCRVDLRRIEQLLENLLENAVKYSPQGGDITVGLWQDDGAIHLTVTDRGIGIPAEDLPHLFDRFHRGTNVDDRRFPGWGLGLSICRRIAEQHGGRISVASREGAGTTFQVTLPATPVALSSFAVARTGS